MLVCVLWGLRKIHLNRDLLERMVDVFGHFESRNRNDSSKWSTLKNERCIECKEEIWLWVNHQFIVCLFSKKKKETVFRITNTKKNIDITSETDSTKCTNKGNKFKTGERSHISECDLGSAGACWVMESPAAMFVGCWGCWELKSGGRAGLDVTVTLKLINEYIKYS